jgi:hypothetical protein
VVRLISVTRNGFVTCGQDLSRRCRHQANRPFGMMLLILLNGRWFPSCRGQLPLSSGARETSGTITNNRSPATTQHADQEQPGSTGA